MDRNAKELREQALRKLAKYYPEEKIVYDRWENYIEIYAAGFKAAPHTMEEILQIWTKSDESYTVGYYYGQLKACLRILNYAIKNGAAPEWLFDIIKTITTPECYAVIKLLWYCGSEVWKERLETAKISYLNRKYEDDDDSVMKFYGVSADRLRSWKREDERCEDLPVAPTAPFSLPDVRAGALEILANKLSEEQKDYTAIDDGIDFFEDGYYAALDKCAKMWIRRNNKNVITERLRDLNDMFKSHTPISEIRKKITATISPEAKPFFDILLKCYEDYYITNAYNRKGSE